MSGKYKPLLISNNPLILTKFEAQNCCKVSKKDDLREVFIEARDLIHRSCSLLTHPLAGSIQPYRNPYRTIAVDEDNGDFDLRSLKIIEKALARYRGRWPDREYHHYNRELLADLEKLDYNLVKKFIKSHE